MSVLNKVNVISSIGYDCKICQKLSPESQESIAGVFSTYAHSWLTYGPDLFVVNNSDGVLQSYWTFGENLQDDLEITCAVELPLEGCAIPLLILGISSENVNLICFFNPNTRKILRTVDIIYPVRTICVIEDGTNEVYPLNDALTPTEGLIAVGCAEGTILLMDLCRSILCKAVNGDFRFYSTEENPSEVVYVSVNAVASGGLSQKIAESRKKKNCVSVILTDPSEEGVTALLYSVESAVLFVGTSSGSFHLWNMSSLSCLFKSPGTNRAIISLSLLEPCDDPRHSLYLWICFEEYAQVAMYCISFSSKFFVHGYGVYYQNFESAGLVYRFTLGMEVDMLAKRPICSQAVAKLVPKNLVRCISLPEAEGTHLRLFITAYEIFDKGQVSIRAVIFDLNQWYRDQMPEEGISACLDSIDLDSKSLWHLQIDPSSLTLYQCVRPQEQHFHPTAFDFQVWCIEEEGVRCLEKLGLQTQWLRNMSRMGSKALVEPTQVFLGALAAGLLPSFVDPPDPEANNEVEERSYVLTICLENRLIVVIEDCVKDWNNGGYTVKGCTIQFLLDWLWNLHKTYKANGNKICIPLFDQSGMKFDVSEKRSLQHCKSLLNTVQSVYTNIVNRFKNTIIINGVEEKLTAMSLVRLYFDCCLKLISVNLLPEPNELGRPSDSVAYHFDDINAYATKRRKEGPFLGDSLLGRTDAEKQWLEEGGTCLYPPPSIQSVLRFCLHPSPSIANKMSLLLYLFMDIVNSYTPIRSQPVLDKIKNFQHLMRISEVQYKIVAGCWYFDHSMFDEGVDLLFDPRVLCVDLSEDQHRGILHLLASEGQEKLALQYLRLKSPTLNLADDLRMELNLLLSNGLVNEAFLFQRKHPEMRETLLVEFFEGCIERKQLGQVFGLNLDFIEEAVLMKYLKSSGLKEKGDLQILLLLSKAKYTEAMFLNDKLNSTINGPKSKIETDTRDMIVRGITGSLNSISRYIANEMKTYRPPPSGSHPQPLSSLIKVRNGPDGPLFQTDGKVLLSAVAKSTRHLSDFVNSFESGHRRKREDKDIDFESENEPSRKRLKLLDSANDVHKMSSLSGKWVHPPCKPSSSQNRDVMELVGTPLVKKRGKRFSPQSRPSSILKGKTPEKSIITEDFGETPKKTIRFALPDNEIQITARKPLRENETTAPATTAEKYSKVDSEDESSTPVTEEPSEPRGLGKLSARKPLHGSDNLNSSVAGLDSTSVIDNIKDRLRSSAKKKVLEDGVNWQEVAEASKPRVLFTQGVSKITSVTKSDKTPSSTPMSQVLLDITVTSAEKKYLDSPSRGEECSPVTEALFNTTLLPKVLFPAVNNDKEKSPEEESSGHAAFLERYKQLRNKNIKSSNAVVTPKERKEKRIRFKEEQSFNVICTKQTVETLKSSVSNSSSMIVIDKELPPKKESTCNQNILKENNDKSDNQLIQNENKVDLELPLNKLNDNILKENNDKSDNQLIQNKNKLELEIPLNKSNENVLKENNDNFDKQLPQNENKLESSISKEEPSNEVLLEETEVHSQDTQKESLLTESENISVNDDLNQDMENSLHENNPLLKDDVFSYKDIDEIVSEKVTEWSDLKSIGVEENPSVEEPIDNLQDGCDYKKPIETEISHDVISNDKTCLSKNELLNDNETLKKEEEILGDCQLDLTKTSAEEKSKESSSDIKTDCVEIIDIASSSEDDNEDKQSYDGSLTEEETEGMSGEFSEEIEEEMSEKEEDGSDNEGSLPEVSSISSDEDAVAKSDEDISANEVCEKSPENNANIDTKVEQTEGTPLIDLSDEEKSIHSSEEKKKKKKYSAKQVSNIETEESKTGERKQCKQGFEEEISDADVFGLKSDISDNKEEGNSEDDLWIGLNDNESTVSDNVKKSKQKRKDNDLTKTESSQKLEFQHNLSNPQEELPRHKKCNLKSLHSTRYSLRKSLSGPNQPNIIKDGIEHNSLYNANLDTKKKKSVTGMVGSETSVLHESADSEIPPVVLNPVSDALSEKEIVEDTGSVNIPREKLFAENEQVVDCILVEEPVIEGVTSFSVERPTTEHNSEESQPVSSPLIADNSPFKNEDSRHVKILENAEVDSELQEDFQSIERNWTQQIEEEMKQDSVILKIESDDRQWHNVDSNKITSKELSDPKLIDLCEPKGKPEVVSSLQTLQVEHIQNNILISEGSKNLSKSLEIGRKDFSVDGTSLSLGDNNMLKKDDICHFDKPECVLPDGEKKYEDDDLVSVTGIDTEIVVSCNQEFKSSESNASLETYESEVLAKSLNKQSVTSLKLSDKDGQNKENITILCSSEKPNDGYNSEVPHLNAEVDDKKITGDCHINISVDNNGIKTSLTILSSEESLVKHTDGALITVQEKHFSSEACSTNISSKENITNKNETLSTGNNVLFFPNEKCKLPGNDVSEINLISVVAESSKLSKNINECFNKSSESASENCDSLTSTQNTEKNMPDSESATSLIEIHENKYSKKGINDENKIIVISDEIVKPGSEVSEFSSEFEVQPSKLSISSEHGEESIGTDTLDKISPQTNRKDNKNDREVSNVNLMHNINDIADKVETNDFISNSEVVVPISSQEKAEISKRKDVTEFKQENTHVEKRPEDKILSGSEVDNHHSTAVDNFSHSLSSDHSCQLSVDTGHGTVSNNILIEHGENVSETNPIVCESKVHEDEKVKEEYISLSVDKDVNPVTESLDCKLNKAKINDSFASDTLNDLTKEANYAIPNVSVSEENNSKICSEKTSVEKSFFFGKEDIETYIRSTKATFQIGSRTSLPEEDEPIDPMEVAMIEDEEKTLPHPSPEPDIDLTLHLSPEHFRKPKKIDQGMVTENSYLQQRARKLRRSSKKLLTDESCERTSKTKITVKSEVYIYSTSSAEKGIKCISTQTSDGVLDEIDLSESEEELIDYAKISGPSRKSILKNKSTRKMRQSSEPPLISKEDLKRKSSIGLGKSDDFTQSNLDQPVRRSRRLSECISETNEPVKNQYEKELRIKSHRKSRCYSEEPDFHRISSYKEKESAGYSSSENDYDGKDKIPERRRSRRHSEEPEMRAVLNKNLEKRKVKSDSTNIDDKYISRRRSNRFSEESDLGNKYPDERSRHSKNPDYTKYSEETEIRGILKKNNRTNRKTSLSCEMINDLKHYEEDDSYQESKKMRSQSEEPELQAIPKKRYRQSRRSSSTFEKAADVHYQLEEIPLDNRKIHRHSEDIEIQGLKKKSSNKSRSSTLPEVDQSEGSRELRKHSEGEIQGILKKNRKDCRISDTETFKLKLLEDVPQERTKRSRRHSEEPETLKILKKRERRSSQSSDIDNESNLQEGVRRIRRHSEEPELRGILKRKSSTSRKSLYISETANDFKLKTEDDLPFESRNDDSDVKGILKKSKSNKRRNSNAIEADNDLLYHTKNQENYDEEYLEKNKNTMKNKRGVYVSGTNDGKSNADDMAMMVTVADDKDDDNKEIESRSSAEQVSENKRSKRFSHLSHEEEHHSIKESPAKVRRRSSSTVIAKEEPADIVSLPEGEIKNTRKSLRRTPDKKVLNAKIVEEKKKKFEPENSKFVPKRLDYSDDESPEIKKSRSLIDFPIKRNSRLPRPALEDIREEDEDLLKKNKKTLDDIHLEEMKKKATSKKKSVSKLVIGDSDADSDVATPELWKKDLIKEKRLTRVQQKTFLMNQQLTSVSEVESPSTSSPRRNVRKKAELTDSPLKTPTRSSLRLQKKPPSEAD